MDHQYYPNDGPYAMPDHRAGPPRQRQAPPAHNRMPQQGGYGAPDPNRGHPAFRSQPPGPPPNGRIPQAPQARPRQYAQPSYQYPTDDYYTGNPYEESNYEYVSNEQWSLPRPYAQQQPRMNSPSRGQMRPPQQPRAMDHPDGNMNQPHPTVRLPPSNRQQPQNRYDNPHVASQWNGSGYGYDYGYDAHNQYPQATPIHPAERMMLPSAGPADYPISGPARLPERSNYDQPHEYQTSPDPRDVHAPTREAYATPGKRTIAPLGPPPSARRGPQTFYQEVGPVRPITEESESLRASSRYTGSVRGGHASVKSYASSNVIPIGLGDYPHDDEIPDLPANYVTKQGSHTPSMQEPSTETTDRDIETPEPPILVREASLGKKSKPNLTTVRRKSSGGNAGLLGAASSSAAGQHAPVPALSMETIKPLNVESKTEPAKASDKSKRYGFSPEMAQGAFGDTAAATAVTAPATSNQVYLNAGDKSKENLSTHTNSSEILTPSGRQGDPSSSDSDASIKRKVSKELLAASTTTPGQQSRSQPRSPLAPIVSPPPAFLSSPNGSDQLKSPKPGFSERAGRSKPPRLDIDAVKKAEQRGSLTSLSDLILRATKLASNLDRGKTASRLGTDWFTSGDTESEKRWAANNRSNPSIPHSRTSTAIFGMGSTPNPQRGSRGTFTSHLQHRTLPSDSDVGELKKQKRKCCGLPVWAFLLLLTLLILCIAAAVLVPIFLIVVPRQNHAGNDHGTQNAALQKCQQSTTCQNGGANIVANDGSCRCICANGYTGTTCSTQSGDGCTMMTAGSTSDATVGNSIPRLISGAQSNFSIPLEGQTILGLFSSADLSCASENALVTFNNAAKRSAIAKDELAMSMFDRDVSATSNSGAASTNGIVYETGSPSATTSGSTSSTASSASSSSSSSSTSTSSNTKSTTAIDFARVAVLYILQVSGEVNVAVTAQESLQAYFTNGQTSSGQKIDPTNISLGNGYTCNLSGHGIGLGNGTEVGNTG